MNKMSQAKQAGNFDPVVCHNLSDIKKALQPFLSDVAVESVEISTKLRWSTSNESGVDDVRGKSENTPLSVMLLDGMNIIKRHVDLKEKLDSALSSVEQDEDDIPVLGMQTWNVDNMRFNVDSLIEKRLGAKRRGLRIRWDVVEGTIEFDPFTKKLYKVEDDTK